jgi:hypothetical protein
MSNSVHDLVIAAMRRSRRSLDAIVGKADFLGG